MKAKLRFSMAIILIVLMLSQVAFAATCDITFTSNGVTHYAIHHTEGTGWFEVLNPVRDTSTSFNNESEEYIAYSQAYTIATEQHLATCPYYNYDLGDESIPMALLYGGVVLVAISAIIVHQKRKGIQ